MYFSYPCLFFQVEENFQVIKDRLRLEAESTPLPLTDASLINRAIYLRLNRSACMQRVLSAISAPDYGRVAVDAVARPALLLVSCAESRSKSIGSHRLTVVAEHAAKLLEYLGWVYLSKTPSTLTIYLHLQKHSCCNFMDR